MITSTKKLNLNRVIEAKTILPLPRTADQSQELFLEHFLKSHGRIQFLNKNFLLNT
jgi:hypothetical protein